MPCKRASCCSYIEVVENETEIVSGRLLGSRYLPYVSHLEKEEEGMLPRQHDFVTVTEKISYYLLVNTVCCPAKIIA